jgi:predicted MFS family arabinose efflux permease
LIENVSWRAVFFINVPLAIIVLALVFLHVPESRDEESKGLDWIGALLATVSLGAIVFGLIESSRLGLSHPMIVTALLVGLVALILFLIVESRLRNPMLPLSMFRSRNFSGANLLTLFLYTALSGALFFLPLNLIQVQGYSPTAAGAALLPFILIMFLLSRWSGGLIKRYGAKLPLVVGPIIVALGFVLFMLPGVGGSYWSTFFPATTVLGLGMAISVAPLTTTVMSSVKENHAGIASGINNAVSRTAGLLAVAVFGLVMLQGFNTRLNQQLDELELSPLLRQELDNRRMRLADMDLPSGLQRSQESKLRDAIPTAFVSGFRHVAFGSAMLAVLSAISAAWLIEGKKVGKDLK